ncbi:ABC transporter ATP-binding protein [Anaeromicropila herbilytica]|uniref:ABC transporter ATP-binding protein n=1 Tax=Anaeromicropila herbilytica TaxID=2785025 RepID=A0A7R7IAV5_9FIRM|nr:ABC transporter ATP-binding protein [Anaeromicropila herbilytica]BCN28837.1 ABC transporter ATP-binding protein [Anaeromicropila herbilytica]
MSVLSITGLNKQIGNHRILKNIEFDVKEQEIVGFLGPNGSGKSTTIKCICGLYHMTSGKILINGADVTTKRKEALSALGASIESPSLYPQLTGRDHLKLMGRWRKVSRERVKEMEEYTGLGVHLDKLTNGYSMGMKMRLMLAMTLLAKPKLIILDEPTNGLDPQAVFELREQMEAIRREGSSILFSSHQLGEVEKLADRVVILDQGEKVYDGIIPTHLMRGLEYHLQVSDVQRAIEQLSGEVGKEIRVLEKGDGWIALTIESKEQFNQMISSLQSNQISVYDIIKCEANLEDFYKTIYERSGSNDKE